ncbi:MAG: 3-phosphoshikimate 1-carboxyvinyltransferase [Pirellulales bacterium]
MPRDMPDEYAITPCGPLRAEIRPPGSKSLTNRALVCAALAEGPSRLSGVLDSDDTRLMAAALDKLGIRLQANFDQSTIDIVGCGGNIPARQADLFIGNSGTSVRFLAAMIALGHGQYRLDGTPRMRQRPIEDLLAGLRQWGADASSEAGTGCPPILIKAQGLAGGPATVRGDVSSQFLSGLLLASPYAGRPVELRVAGTLVSRPYVEMTLEVMRAFGAAVEEQAGGFSISNARAYRGRAYAIEPDASAASYFFAAAAIAGGETTVSGLSRNSLQGDVRFVDVLEQMGCRVRWQSDQITVASDGPAGVPLHGVDVDMNGISDTVQTLAAVALYAQGPTRIRGVGHIRHKETDRIGALAMELRKLGAAVEEFEDGLLIMPGEPRGAHIDTYDDHRMAMSLALVGLRTPGVVIRDPGCTAKTYPAFFDDLERVCATA